MSKVEKLLSEVEQLKDDGKFEDALSVLNKANKISPDNPLVFLSYAVTYDMMDQLESSTVYFFKALRLEPENPKILTHYGITLCKIGKYEEATSAFKKALLTDPDHFFAKWNLGITYRSIGLYEDAVKLMKECIACDEEDFAEEEIHYQLGSVYYDMGWTHEAVREVQAPP